MTILKKDSCPKNKIILSIIVFCFFSNLLIGQPKTVYEKKCFTITAKYLEAINVSKSVLENKNVNDYGNLLTYYMQRQRIEPRASLIFILKYQEEILNAKKSMTPTEIEREKLKIEREKEEIKLKEKQEKDEIAQRKYNNSDLSKIKSSVESRLKKWYLQGEFEKSDTHKTRILKEGENQIKQINIEAFQMVINNFEILVELDTYLPNEEVFPIKCTITNRSVFESDFSWNDKIKIPIAEAPSFKQSWGYQSRKFIGTKDCRNWGFFDNTLFPKSIIINLDNKSFESNLPLPSFNNYVVSFSSFGLNIPEIKNIEFNLFGYQTWTGKFN